MKWVYSITISYVPVIIIYGKELFNEAFQSQKNLMLKKDMLFNFINISL